MLFRPKTLRSARPDPADRAQPRSLSRAEYRAGRERGGIECARCTAAGPAERPPIRKLMILRVAKPILDVGKSPRLKAGRCMALQTATARDGRGSVEEFSRFLNPCGACAVRNGGICAPLKPRELRRLSAIASRSRLAAEQVVFCEGDSANTVFAVTDGTVRLSKMLLDGRRQITGFVSPGGFLGIAYSDTYAYSAEAVTSLGLCRFPRRQLEDPQNQMVLLGRKSAEEKVASFLWQWCLKAGRREKTDCVIDLPMNRTDIADYLGLTTETVSRTFSRFAKQGILRLPSTHDVVLQRPERLEEMASGEF
jgi:CRP/FNR family transcriptional regulator